MLQYSAALLIIVRTVHFGCIHSIYIQYRYIELVIPCIVVKKKHLWYQTINQILLLVKIIGSYCTVEGMNTNNTYYMPV